MSERKNVLADDLNALMEFDHVILVHEDGTVSEPRDVYAPEVDGDGRLFPSGAENSWSLMDGYSGQQGYSGPHMHQSEFIVGGLARNILATPGYYVALIVEEDGEDTSPMWAVAYREAN